MKIVMLEGLLPGFGEKLCREGKATRTITKYVRDAQHFLIYAQGVDAVNLETVREYAEILRTRCRASTCNSYLISINAFFAYVGHKELRVPLFQMQRRYSRENELTPENYRSMLAALERDGKWESRLILRTLGKTGIRVGELSYITREAADRGWAEIQMKGKLRQVFLPGELCEELIHFCAGADGPIFRSRDGKSAVNSAVVWRRLKSAARRAGVEEAQVYPHNLRHMFARVYMETYGNIMELADILGHSSIETTRIYTRTTSAELIRRVEGLPL